MAIYCVSDLHLHDDDQPYLFTTDKEAVLVALADEVLRDGDSNFVLAGDFLDLTGMNPPVSGVRDFFEKTLPAERIGQALELAGPVRDAATRVKSVAARFAAAFAALGRLARAGRLIFVPGNHDWEAGYDPGGRQAFATALGVTEEQLPVKDDYAVDGIWIGAHGHDFDPSNMTSSGVVNRGQVITAALYRVLMPALRILGMPEAMVAAIPAVRPEENIVDGIEAALPQKDSDACLRALVQLLYDNGYFQGLVRAEVWTALRLFPGVLTARRVRENLANDSDMKDVFRRSVADLLDGKDPRYGGKKTKLVVLGHTHEFDYETGRYVNLGTWIDHVPNLSAPALAAPEYSLPVLRVDGDSVVVHDLRPLIARPGKIDTAPKMAAFVVG
jgi:UDP-2,3-diacylglucosamine pyrophosphatase LpxH